ncbi:hypothetical protein ALC53_00952 [Atta colombica]|uniref:Uncharacterized protein n=1 Tax=Atta colombica TaxID=520822 RepID=A0A195BX08_9HYME|nr:hypothetical protein ALC53_00952 [Atta colombica]
MLMAHVIPAGCQVQVESGCGRVLAAAGLGAGRVAAVAGLLVGRQTHRALLKSKSCDGFNENSKITFVTESKGDGGCDVDRMVYFFFWFKDNSISPVVGCRLEDDERDDREVVLEPRARHPPCCDASECLFSRKPSRAAGEFLYQSGTLSRCNDRCTLSSCSLGTRSPTFCSSFSGGCNDKFMFVFFSSSVRNSLEVVREFDAKKYLKSNLPKN